MKTLRVLSTRFACLLKGAIPIVGVFFFSALQPIDVLASDFKLQWFDTEGHIVDVNWSVTNRWIWKETRANVPAELTQEVWVQFPKHVKVVDTFGNPDLRLVESSTQDSADSDSGQTLIILTRSSSSSFKLAVDFGDGQKVDHGGLSVTIVGIDSPRILIHQSCVQMGMDLKLFQSQGVPPFFLGISCSFEKADVVVHFHYPDAYALKDETSPGVLSEVLRFKREKIPSVESRRFRLEDKSNIYEFDLAMGLRSANTGITSRHQSSTQSTQASSVRLEGHLAFSALTYGVLKSKNQDYDPTVFNLETGARAQLMPEDPSQIAFEGDLRFPVLAILPGPFHLPTSGDYSMGAYASRPSWGFLTGSSIRVLPGLAVHGIYLEHRTDASGVLVSPQLLFSMSGEKSHFFGNRSYEARASAFPLFGGGKTPFFHSFGLFALLSVELYDSFFFGKKLNLETRFDYFNLSTKGGDSVGVSAFTLGIQVWI